MTGTNLTFTIFPEKQVILRQQRRGLRTKVGEDESADLLCLVSRMLDALLESTVFRLGRLIQTCSTDIVEPTMITTPDASVLDPAEFQGSSTVRTVQA